MTRIWGCVRKEDEEQRRRLRPGFAFSGMKGLHTRLLLQRKRRSMLCEPDSSAEHRLDVQFLSLDVDLEATAAAGEENQTRFFSCRFFLLSLTFRFLLFCKILHLLLLPFLILQKEMKTPPNA
jgi:hypothetical protein